MKTLEGTHLETVQAVYNGPEGDLWELVMGEQIHIGGFASSMALAEKADIKEGMNGIDLCCCSGAGMRFLVRFRRVASMQGVDATTTVVTRGERRCAEEGLGDRISFHLKDVQETGLPDGKADFVWGEDAWCYVVDKRKLVQEAVRLVRPGGTVAFTDWVEGSAGLSDEEAKRFMTFMKFPSLASISDYRALLEEAGCEVTTAEDTEQFPLHVDLYLGMLNRQLTYDALKIIGFNLDLMQGMGAEMGFMQGLAHERKIAQGRFIATKK